MPRVTIGGIRFYYQQSGQGPDVVLIHGITGNMAIWPLIDLVRHLSTDFRVTYYDMRGHGYSDTPPTNYTSADMAHDLRRLQEALGLGPSYLIGHSFGGVVAVHAAVLYPEAVRGLVLSDPYFPALRHLERNVPQWPGWQAYKERSARCGLEIPDDAWFDVNLILQQAAQLPPARKAMFEKELGAPALQRLVRLAATTCGTDSQAVAGLTEDKIRSVQQPVLALYGERSPFLATCRYLEENLPNCRVAFVPQAEHLAHEENPAGYVEQVTKHLRQMAGLEPGWQQPQRELVGGGV
ncbi:MAG: alpha/beta hydrolase [Gemmataceae bacterium]|nr:alpha/beta hydrolase [Gemmataceae bacterium]MDW8265365.1 alpha/beta hydrolase [Gemmataceae bacterium]